MAARSHMVSERRREAKRVAQADRRAGGGFGKGAATEAEDRLMGALQDILESPRADILSFLKVAGIGDMLDRVPPERFWDEFRQHYATPDGGVDEERFATDLSIWPPIAMRAAEIRAGRG